MTDEAFTLLLEAAEPEQVHAFALAVYDAAWSDGAAERPQIVLGDRLARFVQAVAIEHGARHAERQQRTPPEWLIRMQDPE